MRVRHRVRVTRAIVDPTRQVLGVDRVLASASASPLDAVSIDHDCLAVGVLGDFARIENYLILFKRAPLLRFFR